MMCENQINQSLCRLCGCKNENGQILNDDSNSELLDKVQTTFSLLVSKNVAKLKRKKNIFYFEKFAETVCQTMDD